MTTAVSSAALTTIQPVFTEAERVALAGFLAGYRGLGLDESLGVHEFFQVTNPGATPVGRTLGLLQAGDDPGNAVGQWPRDAGLNFAVNPINRDQIQ